MRERDPELFAAWKADRLLQPVAEGETFADLAARVVPAVRELVFNFPGWRIALACHAGPIRVTLADALGMPLERALNFALDYGCVNVIEFPAGGSPRVKLVNG
jgi:probable phosphoglycerate mutase